MGENQLKRPFIIIRQVLQTCEISAVKFDQAFREKLEDRSRKAKIVHFGGFMAPNVSEIPRFRLKIYKITRII